MCCVRFRIAHIKHKLHARGVCAIRRNNDKGIDCFVLNILVFIYLISGGHFCIFFGFHIE